MTLNTPSNLQPFTNAAQVLDEAIKTLSNEPPKVVVTADRLNQMALTVEITDADSYEDACEDLTNIMANKKQVEAMRKEAKQPFIDGGKAIDAFFKKPQNFLASAESTLKTAISKADDERNAKAEAEAEKAEAAKNKAIQAAIESGDTEQASALENAVIPTVSLEVKGSSKGISKRKAWKAKVEDLSLLLTAILDPKNEIATADLISINQSGLDKIAKAMKSKQVLAGVKFYQSETIVAKSK